MGAFQEKRVPVPRKYTDIGTASLLSYDLTPLALFSAGPGDPRSGCRARLERFAKTIFLELSRCVKPQDRTPARAGILRRLRASALPEPAPAPAVADRERSGTGTHGRRASRLPGGAAARGGAARCGGGRAGGGSARAGAILRPAAPPRPPPAAPLLDRAAAGRLLRPLRPSAAAHRGAGGLPLRWLCGRAKRRPGSLQEPRAARFRMGRGPRRSEAPNRRRM